MNSVGKAVAFGAVGAAAAATIYAARSALEDRSRTAADEDVSPQPTPAPTATPGVPLRAESSSRPADGTGRAPTQPRMPRSRIELENPVLQGAMRVMRRTDMGAVLHKQLSKAGARISVLPDRQFRQLYVPRTAELESSHPGTRVAAVARGIEIVFPRSSVRAMDDPRRAAVLLAHEATHVFDSTYGLFSDAYPSQRYAARRAQALFAAAGLDAAEGAAWVRRSRDVHDGIMGEAHASHNAARVAIELGVASAHVPSPEGAAVTASGSLKSIRATIKAMEHSEFYRDFYGIATG